jgi:hypothetical protein
VIVAVTKAIVSPALYNIEKCLFQMMQVIHLIHLIQKLHYILLFKQPAASDATVTTITITSIDQTGVL